MHGFSETVAICLGAIGVACVLWVCARLVRAWWLAVVSPEADTSMRSKLAAERLRLRMRSSKVTPDEVMELLAQLRRVRPATTMED